MLSSVQQLGDSVSLPKLEWQYDALEPYISGKINEIHHSRHHQAYVDGYNNSFQLLIEAKVNGDLKKVVELQNAIKFFAGGHINHVLFWKSLSPVSQEGGKHPSDNSALGKQIKSQFGTIDNLISIMNSKLASIQGSGWCFLVKNPELGSVLEVITTANQDTVSSPHIPILAIDAWEHAYYLQYQNKKLDYFKAIWNVINWKEAERAFDGNHSSQHRM